VIQITAVCPYETYSDLAVGVLLAGGHIMVVAGTTPNMGRMEAQDFAKNPMLVYWEMTQACGLACKHCRAEAMPTANPLELTTDQSKKFLRQLVDFGDSLPHLILTGGDPLSRKDIYELIDYANGLGLEVSITPSATPELTNDAITKLKKHGIQSLGLSLDGSCAAKHDAIRAVPGTFDRTIEAARHCGRLGLPIQVNTLVAEETADDLPAIYELLRTSFPVMRWSLFFLISVGRGKALNEVSPEEGEIIMRWVFDLSQHSPFAVKTTEAPSYRRIAIERMRTSGMAKPEMKQTSVYKGFQIRDGHGIVFVSNLGEVYPSGFLPLHCGNVRNGSLIDIYRNSDVFRSLHSPDEFHGKCGVCEYSHICGGSRARAFAHTGDVLGSDPFCPYEPAGIHTTV
jgi:radical SAM protein